MKNETNYYAFGALLAGILSFRINPFAVVSILAIFLGIKGRHRANSQQEKVLSTVGVVLGAVVPVIVLMIAIIDVIVIIVNSVH